MNVSSHTKAPALNIVYYNLRKGNKLFLFFQIVEKSLHSFSAATEAEK